MVVTRLFKLMKLQHPGKDMHSFILWSLGKFFNYPAAGSWSIALIWYIHIFANLIE